MNIVPDLMNMGAYNFFAKMAKEKPPLRQPNREYIKLIIETFTGKNYRRNESLYVDTDGLLPSEKISEDEARFMIGIVDRIISSRPWFLKVTDEELQNRLNFDYFSLFEMPLSELLRSIGKYYVGSSRLPIFEYKEGS